MKNESIKNTSFSPDERSLNVIISPDGISIKRLDGTFSFLSANL